MNYLEAINELELARAEIEWEYPMSISAAIDVGIEAIKKQIPHRAVWEKDERDALSNPRCPKCDAGLLLTVVRYCFKCGQAIDWSIDFSDIYGE